MLKFGCQMRMTQFSPRIYHSIPGRVPCVQSVFTTKISLNQQYCVHRILSTAALVEKSRSWQPPELQKLYEDDWVVAISKPGSLLVHNSKEASKEERERKAFLKDLVEAQHTQGRGASGVIIFAKSSLAAHAAQLSLAHEVTVKEYLVLARGSTPDCFVCDDPVNDDKGIPRSAWTKCDKLLDLPKSRCSLLKVFIKTGRRHQIRKHLNHKAFHVSPQPFPDMHWLSRFLSIHSKLGQNPRFFSPLVIGDGRHGKGQTNQYFRENYEMPLGRCFLHAARLTVPHPSIFAALCVDKQQRPTGGLESLPQMKSELNSEQNAKDFAPPINIDSGSLPQSILKTSGGLQIDYSGQTLTLRASLPTELRRVLLALPDGLSSEFLDSLDAVI